MDHFEVFSGTKAKGLDCSRPWLLGGGDEEDRTPDLRIANATLSQLSYVPTRGAIIAGSGFRRKLPLIPQLPRGWNGRGRYPR